MKRTMLILLAFSFVLAGSGATMADPIPSLAPQSIPPDAMRAIDAVNQATEGSEAPVFDGRSLSIGLGVLAGVLVYNMLPSGMLMGRAVPVAAGAMGRIGSAVATARATTQLPMMTSAVVGGLVGDYSYRKNNRIPSVPPEIAGRVRP